MYDNALGVWAEGLGKRYGELWALQDLDLAVPAGSVLGLLGHNGAGKTTAIRLLTTLAEPTAGAAAVAGHDVRRDPAAVRRSIAVVGQSATVDGLLTGRANLEMIGRLYGLSHADARRRAAEVLDQVRLGGEAADRLAKTYSGGMRRRLDIAASLVPSARVLFLDEPTTGLDPQSRNDLWELLREQVAAGVTLILTTQYLEEADRLADDILVLDQGRVAGHGTPAELKRAVGGERVDVHLAAGSGAGVAAAIAALAPYADGPAAGDDEQRSVSVPVRPGTRLVEVVRALDAAGVDAHDVSRREPTLDDVFLSLTSTTQEAPA